MDRGDRWLVGWGLGYVAVGAASLLVPLYAISLGGGLVLASVLIVVAIVDVDPEAETRPVSGEFFRPPP